MKGTNKRTTFIQLAIGILLLLLLAVAATVYAGTVLDYGQLIGNPQLTNYLAWVGSSTPPLQVLTEDSYNTQDGTNQGYVESTTQAGQNYFLLNAGNFDDPAATDGMLLHMLFGGNGMDSGTIWQMDATYDASTAYADHGTVINTWESRCPAMLPHTQNAGGTELYWVGNGAEQYYIYRSLHGSGAENGASNGRYNYVETIPGDTESYLDTACATGTACWHIIVPADGTGAIAGCHSAESPPPHQQLPLLAGWNMISTYLQPADTDLELIFAPLEDQLTLLKNGNGEVYWPAFDVNQIGSWTVVEGYQLHIQSAQTLAVPGGRANLLTISSTLSSGWHIVGYWRETPMAVETAWASLAGNLFLAKDGDGHIYWPDLGIDDIGALQPGQGYQIYFTSEGTLSYPVDVPPAE